MLRVSSIAWSVITGGWNLSIFVYPFPYLKSLLAFSYPIYFVLLSEIIPILVGSHLSVVFTNEYNKLLFALTEKPGKPGTPSLGEIGKRTAALTWSPPTSDGGSPITNYVVEYKIEGGYKWTKANDLESVSDCAYTVRGLKEEMVYEFRVSAENKAGVGPPSDSTKPTLIEEPVGKRLIIFTMKFSQKLIIFILLLICEYVIFLQLFKLIMIIHLLKILRFFVKG